MLGGVVEKAISPGPFRRFGFALRARGRVAWRLKKGCQNTRASVPNPLASLILSSGKVTISLEALDLAAGVMSSFVKYLIGAATCLILAGTAASDAGPPGFLEGNLKIVSPRAVESSDNMPRPAVEPETYAKYPLIVFSADEKREIARVTADVNGNYRIALPPGAYILDVQDRTARRLRAKPQPFTVVSNQTVRVDMNILTGFPNRRL